MSTLRRSLIETVQTRLAELGYYRLIIDGIPGPGMSNAVVDFKEAHGLRPRDHIGPITLRTLFADNAKPAPPPFAQVPASALPVKGVGLIDPPWLVEARRLLGTRERRGPGNNPVIMDWADKLDQWYPGDDTAWCGLFVAHCMAAGAPNEPQHFNRLGARNWLKYGRGCDTLHVPYGSVCVLWRTAPTHWHGHVFIVTGQSATGVRGIGGNQSDAVTEAWFSRDRVLGYRIPQHYSCLEAPTARQGVLSTNEA